jgi:protoporphyrin/coproporphyrin ferrochelatase
MMQTGVLLFNLGGPETLDEVRPFLYNLFSDPEIIRIKSDLLRRMLARFIVLVRQKKSCALYSQIGGGSPLRKITESQAAALEAALSARNLSARVYVAMRCWNPSIDRAVEDILRDGISRLFLLPLFPQYSVTTTGSCLKYFHLLDQKAGLSSKIRISEIQQWFDDPRYLESMAELIREAARELPGRKENLHLLYSAHSIPVRYIKEGDPYLDQTRRSVALINERLGNAYSFTLAFQSKVGPVEWLGPSTADVLRELGKTGKTAVLVVPVSFVSDHIETLQEIDISYREIAAKSGIREFRRVPSLNTYPSFIGALADMVLKNI